MYDYRGRDGTGNKDNKVTPDSTNAQGYIVRKLADGNCWMTEDLMLPLAAGVEIEATYNATATTFSFTPVSCGTAAACAMNANTSYSTATNSYYYSWYAAVAGSGAASDISVDAPASICPVGWRLPANYTIDPNKSWGSLTNSYGFTTNGVNNSQNHVVALKNFPLYFNFFGAYQSGSIWANEGQHGYYWSSTASTSATTAYSFYIHPSLTYPQNSSYQKYYGMLVRCVAQ